MSVPLPHGLLLAVALLAGVARQQGAPPEPDPAGAAVEQEQESGEPQGPGPDADSSEAPPEPRPISEGRILTRAEVVSSALRGIEGQLEPDPALDRISGELERKELEFLLSRAELDGLDLDQVTVLRLEDLRLPWLEFSQDLARWKSRAEVRFEALQDRREYLRGERAAWELTRDGPPDHELSEELLAAVDATLERVVDVESRLRERRDQVGSLLQRIVTSEELTLDALDRLDEATQLVRRSWLTRGAPLWEAFEAEALRSPAPGTLDAADRWIAAQVDYAELVPGRLLALAATFLLLLWGTLALRRKQDGQVTSGDGKQHTSRLLQRPYSVALAGALLLTLPLLPYPRGSATDVLLVLAVLPIVRLGPVVLRGGLRRVLYLVVGLTLLTRFTGLWADESLGSRLLLLSTTALGLGVAVVQARTGGGEPTTRRGRFVRWLAATGALLLAVGLGANLLGWTELSRELTVATIASVFSALAWLVVVIAFAGDLLPLVIASPVGSWLSSLRRNEEMVTRVLGRLFTLIAVLMWLRSTSIRFRLDGPLLEGARKVAASRLELGDLSLSVGGLLAATLVLLAAWMLARLTRFVLQEQVFPSMSLRRGSGESILSVSNYAIWGVGIALAAASAGLSGTHLAVLIGALGLGIGFGLQTIVHNFVSGLILLFERPIKVGDTLEMSGWWGRVERIGIRASVIRSFEGAEVIVPNADLVSKEVTNWTGSDEIRRLEVLVGVAYGSDPEVVLEVLRRVADEHEQVLRWPEVTTEMIGFGDSALEFRLRCWTPVDRRLAVSSDLHVAIVRELGRAGIPIPFPQRDLHIKSMPQGAPPGPASSSQPD
jgi:small-conductance mechanosensitive channel